LGVSCSDILSYFVTCLHFYVNRAAKPLRDKLDYNEYNFANIIELWMVTKKQNKNSVAAAERKKKNKPMRELIRLKQWPEGGLQELRYRCNIMLLHVRVCALFIPDCCCCCCCCRRMHVQGFACFSAILAVRQAGFQLDSTQFAYCNRYVLTSLYTWKENSRPMAIENLLLTGELYILI
jgi:hypothetical protein